MLQVAMGGEVISSSVVFEYKARDLPALPSSQHDWLSLDGESTGIFLITFPSKWAKPVTLNCWGHVSVCMADQASMHVIY